MTHASNDVTRTIQLRDERGTLSDVTITVSARADRKRLPKGRPNNIAPTPGVDRAMVSRLADHIVSWTGWLVHGEAFLCTRRDALVLLDRDPSTRQQVAETVRALQQPGVTH